MPGWTAKKQFARVQNPAAVSLTEQGRRERDLRMDVVGMVWVPVPCGLLVASLHSTE